MSDRLSVMRGRVLHLSEQEAVRPHRTPAYKLVVGVDAEVTFSCGSRSGRLRAVLVPPGLAQALEAHGLAIGVFQAAGSALAPYVPRGSRPHALGGQLRDRLVGLARACARQDGADDAHYADEAFRLLGLSGIREQDARVAAALEALARDPALSLSMLARRVGLSAERLRHLVAAQTGMALREHTLLQRTALGIEKLFEGRSIANAAVAAGFSDHAHFTRSFGRMFGRTPSSMPGRSLLHASFAARAGDAGRLALRP